MTIYASDFLMLCALLAVYVGCAFNATASEASKNNDRRFALVCAILGLFFWIAAAAACRELINKRAFDARSDAPELERLTDAALEKCRLP